MPTTKLPGLYYKITRVDAAYREPKGNACLSSLTQKALIKGKCHAVSTLTSYCAGVDLRSILWCFLSYFGFIVHNSTHIYLCSLLQLFWHHFLHLLLSDQLPWWRTINIHAYPADNKHGFSSFFFFHCRQWSSFLKPFHAFFFCCSLFFSLTFS